MTAPNRINPTDSPNHPSSALPMTSSPLRQKTTSAAATSEERAANGRQMSLLSFFGSPKPKLPTTYTDVSSPLAKKDTSTNGRMPRTPQNSNGEEYYTMESDQEVYPDNYIECEEEIIKPGSKLNFSKKIRIDEDDVDSISTSSVCSPVQSFDLSRFARAQPTSSPLKPSGNSLNMTSSPRSSIAPLSFLPSTDLDEVSQEEPRYSWLVNVRDADGLRPGDPNYDPRTIYIPPAQLQRFTPFERQFWEIKSKVFDTIVFFKKGKFYELYEQDADVGAREFDLKLIDRVNMRMVGVPEASFDFWAAKFVAAGHKIARVDQTETAIGKSMREKAANSRTIDKVVRRELTCVLTAGTLVEPTMLASDLPTYCIAIKEVAFDHAPPSFGIAIVDAATAHFMLSEFNDDGSYTRLETLLSQLQPKEILLEKSVVSLRIVNLIKSLLPFCSINHIRPGSEFWEANRTIDELDRSNYFGGAGNPEALVLAKSGLGYSLSAFGALIWYLRSLKLDASLLSLRRIDRYTPLESVSSLLLDGTTLENLDILRNNIDGTTRGSLFKLIDQCITPFGRRLLRIWLCHPLRSATAINKRLDAVEHLLNNGNLRDMIHGTLHRLPDLERLVSRINASACKIKDFLLVLDSMQQINNMANNLKAYELESCPELLGQMIRSLPEMTEALEYFTTAFNHEKARNEGLVIPEKGVELDFDEVEALLADISRRFEEYLCEQERVLKTKNLRYRDIGKEVFQLEIPAGVSVPKEYTTMSKTKAVNRYWTPVIRNLVREFQEAEEVKASIVSSLLARMLQKFSSYGNIWREAIQAIAELDCIISLSICSMKIGEPRCRPIFYGDNIDSMFDAEELRHPCLVSELRNPFLPNDIKMGANQDRMIILTGPNMGGKSTLLRQTCVAAILAQIGCYVPARSLKMTPFDRIFTRLGANDNIMAGQSTFMVELSETSKILKEATSRSLVILDELGRGTSTFDGLAIAHAVLHYLVHMTGCIGLFATHYRMLATEFQGNPLVGLFHMSCAIESDARRVVFLYKLVRGLSPKSYGLNVAAMAGIPLSIIDEAEMIADQLERSLVLGESHKDRIPLPIREIFDFIVLQNYKTTTSSTPIGIRQLAHLNNQ